MLELGVAWELEGFIVSTDLTIEKYLKKRGWLLKRLGPVHEIQGRHYVIGLLPVSQKILNTFQDNAKITEPVLTELLYLPKSVRDSYLRFE